MNTQSIQTMCDWERKKAVFLMNYAENTLQMNLSSYGEIGVNQTSGNVYLWLEDYSFCLYMPINCELQRGDIFALYSCPETGEETEISCDNITDVSELYEWVESLIELKNN